MRLGLVLLGSMLISLGAWGASLQLDIGETVLDNGMKILTLEDHSVPVVAVYTWYRVGGRNEHLGSTGLSHMLEHLMFSGTENLPKEEFSRYIQSYGGYDNAFTGDDYTGYVMEVPSNILELVIWIEADRLLNTELTRDFLRTEREVVYEERRMRYDNSPMGNFTEQFGAISFLVHPYRDPVIGWPEDIENWKFEQLRDHYRTYYVPNNCVMVIVGDFDTEQTVGWVKEYFEQIPTGPVPPSQYAVEPEQKGERRFEYLKEAQSPVVRIGYHIPAYDHPDQYALSALSSILTGGKSSRLFQRMVYQDQIALSASGGNYEQQDPSLFYVTTILRPGVPSSQGEATMLEEIERFMTEPVSDLELEKAKNQISTSFIRDQEQFQQVARLIGYYEMMGSYKFLETFLDKINEVTKHDIIRVAKTYFKKRNRTVGILIPETPGEQEESGS